MIPAWAWAGSHKSDRVATITIAMGIPDRDIANVRCKNLNYLISYRLHRKLLEMGLMRIIVLVSAWLVWVILQATVAVAVQSC